MQSLLEVGCRAEDFPDLKQGGEVLVVGDGCRCRLGHGCSNVETTKMSERGLSTTKL